MTLVLSFHMIDSTHPLIVGDIQASITIILTNFHWVIAGVLIGMVFGVIPGLGGSITLALLVPMTLFIRPEEAFILLSSAWGGTTFSGSITAILLNTPGSASNAATLLDGYPLTREGKGDYAIGASAASSAIGAVIAVIIFIALIPVMADIVLLFGSAEYFWMVVIGISIIPLITSDNVMGGLIMGVMGILLSLIGRNLQTAEVRFAFDQVYLMDGIQFIPVIVGLFAISEMIRLTSTESGIVSPPKGNEGSKVEDGSVSYTKIDGIKAVLNNKYLVLQSSMVGLFTGIAPGIGGVTAAFIAYALGKETSSNSKDWGSGVIEGVIAPEAANDAKDGGQLFPTLGLGIPGSASAAIILGAFMLHGITPDPRMLSNHLDIVLIIAISLLFSNVMTSVIGLIVADKLKYIVTHAPTSTIYTTIMVLSLMSVFILRYNIFDVLLAFVMGIIGIYCMVLNLSRITFVIGLILGTLAEQNYQIALLINDGNHVEAFFTGPINITLIFLVILILSAPLIKHVRELQLH